MLEASYARGFPSLVLNSSIRTSNPRHWYVVRAFGDTVGALQGRLRLPHGFWVDSGMGDALKRQEGDEDQESRPKTKFLELEGQHPCGNISGTADYPLCRGAYFESCGIRHEPRLTRRFNAPTKFHRYRRVIFLSDSAREAGWPLVWSHSDARTIAVRVVFQFFESVPTLHILTDPSSPTVARTSSNPCLGFQETQFTSYTP